jgi:hypothetical protein
MVEAHRSTRSRHRQRHSANAMSDVEDRQTCDGLVLVGTWNTCHRVLGVFESIPLHNRNQNHLHFQDYAVALIDMALYYIAAMMTRVVLQRSAQALFANRCNRREHGLLVARAMQPLVTREVKESPCAQSIVGCCSSETRLVK